MPKVTSNYPGTIDFPTETEGPFEDIIYGAPCNLEITYNSDIVPAAGPFEYLTNGGADGYIDLLISDQNYITNTDNSGNPGWPIIQFNDGEFIGLSFYTEYTESVDTYVFSVNGLDWNIVDAKTNEVMASGTISNQAGSN
jgi:hypothetical protein